MPSSARKKKLAPDQVGSADEGRLHALHDGVAAQFGAYGLGVDRACSDATDEIAATPAPHLAGFQIAHADARRALRYHHLFSRGPVDDAYTWIGRSMIE